MPRDGRVDLRGVGGVAPGIMGYRITCDVEGCEASAPTEQGGPPPGWSVLTWMGYSTTQLVEILKEAERTRLPATRPQCRQYAAWICSAHELPRIRSDEEGSLLDLPDPTAGLFP